MKKRAAADSTPPRILIVDDHPVFRRGMAALLQENEEFAVCAEAEDAKSALDAMRQSAPDLVLMDISMPGTNGIEIIKLMLAEQPQLAILIVSMHDESLYAMRALRAGAKGYVMKAEAQTQVVEALRKVLAGGVYVSPQYSERLIYKIISSPENESGSPVDMLSDRELEVLQLIGKGTSTGGIASELHLSIKTIETHRARIKEKLGFHDGAEMVRFAVEWAAHQQV
jgi:DNA-binding NarL/FixJ family response regulator